jgi:hypothetical protein
MTPAPLQTALKALTFAVLLSPGIVNPSATAPPDPSEYVVSSGDGELSASYLQRRPHRATDGTLRTTMLLDFRNGFRQITTLDVNCEAQTVETHFTDWFNASRTFSWRERHPDARKFSEKSLLYLVTCLGKTPDGSPSA